MKKILVCDDDIGISEVMKIMLEEAGYDVNIMNNGRAIQKRIDQYRPDLILLDVWMPGINGKEILSLLKKDTKSEHVPVILVSALNNTKEISKDYGADDFLAKPFDMGDLLSKVKKYTSLINRS